MLSFSMSGILPLYGGDLCLLGIGTQRRSIFKQLNTFRFPLCQIVSSVLFKQICMFLSNIIQSVHI